jgi:hypothetical protein
MYTVGEAECHAEPPRSLRVNNHQVITPPPVRLTNHQLLASRPVGALEGKLRFARREVVNIMSRQLLPIFIIGIMIIIIIIIVLLAGKGKSGQRADTCVLQERLCESHVRTSHIRVSRGLLF